MAEAAEAATGGATNRACDWCGCELERERHVLEVDAIRKLYCSTRCNDRGFRAELSRPIFHAPKAMHLRQALLAGCENGRR
jgi:hypothetical protein